MSAKSRCERKAIDAQRRSTAELMASAGALLAVEISGKSHPFRYESMNKDAFLVGAVSNEMSIYSSCVIDQGLGHGARRGHLYAVAEDEGDDTEGTRAAGIAVAVVRAFPFLIATDPSRCAQVNIPGQLREVLRLADRAVVDEGRNRRTWRTMGASLTVALSAAGSLFVGHAGRSRSYLFRGNALVPVTSVTGAGRTPADDPFRDADDNAQEQWLDAANAVGSGTELGLETRKIGLEPGDVVLLCTRVLSEFIPDGRIADILGSERQAERACDRLIGQARVNGARGRITVVVARYQDS